MAFTAEAFAGHEEFGNFQDAGAVAAGLGKYVGHTAGVFFAIALIDACVIGAMAVSLSTAYAIGDVLSLRHSLHRKPKDAKAFYAVYGGLVALSAALVLTPGTPLGLLTNAVQSLERFRWIDSRALCQWLKPSHSSVFGRAAGSVAAYIPTMRDEIGWRM